MRNATLILALSGVVAGAVSLLPAIQPKNAKLLLPVVIVGQALPDTAACQAEPDLHCHHTATAAAQNWCEKLFTAGLTKDFGAVPFGTQLLHRFAIKNFYQAPVEITGFRISCGCVKAVPGKQILQPGESSTIDVSLDTREFTGHKTQTIRVGFDGPWPRAACVLTVSAVSQTDVVFEPDRISFGTVARGRTSVQSIDIEYKGASPWTIQNVIIAKELPLEASVSDLVRQTGKGRYRLTVKLKDDARPGRIRDYIYLRTNQTDAPPVAVLVTASVLEGVP
jgi:hypothetical protein